MSHTANVILVLVLLCALKVPIIIPKIPETITPNVAIYMVINALSHHSVRALTEWWDRALITMYMATFGVIVSGILGIIIGTLSAQSKTSTKITLAVCDTLQTFPSFIYLIPVIMLFGVTDTSVLIAVVIYATIPATRYTIEGLRSVPSALHDAGSMS